MLHGLLAVLAALPLSDCRLQGLAQPARCGALDVPENPAHPGGRHLSIAVAIVPASATPTRSDPIVVLSGGPGEDAIGSAAFYVKRLSRLLTDRDLLLVDQRGTGRSAALHCSLYSAQDPAATLRDVFPLAAVARCAKQLSAHADLTQYGYTRFASDLEQVRLSLGYGAPQSVRGLVRDTRRTGISACFSQKCAHRLSGQHRPDGCPDAPALRSARPGGTDRLFRDCAADSACQAAFPRIADEFTQVLARLETGTVRVTLSDQAQPAVLTRGRVAEWVRSKLYRPSSAADLPWMIHRAFEGNWHPIADAILEDARGADSDLSFGLFFSITCSEDVAFIPPDAVENETRDTFLGDYRVRQQQAACRLWPTYSPAPGYRAIVHSLAPVLIVSGDTDGAMPLSYAQHVAPGFPNGVEIVLRGLGHTEWSECIAARYEQFVRTAIARGLDTPPCDAVPRPAFKIR